MGEEIATGVIGPRLCEGGIELQISSWDAQLVKPTSSHIVILLTGEATARPVSIYVYMVYHTI